MHIGFAVILVLSGIYVLIGYTIEPSFMLACTVLSFSAAIVQLLSTRITSLSESWKVFKTVRSSIWENGGKRSGYKRWYEKRVKCFERLCDVILYPSVVISLGLFTGLIQYSNDSLSNGLALLTMALLFLDSFLCNKDRDNIRKYKHQYKETHEGKE